MVRLGVDGRAGRTVAFSNSSGEEWTGRKSST